MRVEFSHAAKEKLCEDLPGFIPPMIEWDLVTAHLEEGFEAQSPTAKAMLLAAGFPNGVTFLPFKTNEHGQTYLTAMFGNAVVLEIEVGHLFPGTKVALDPM
jgi:hypothetical protein